MAPLRGAAGSAALLQAAIETLTTLDADSCAQAMVTALEQRPELAPPVVNAVVPALTYPPSSALTVNRSHGVIKSFNAIKGFGFIACEALHEIFGQDVFLHKYQMGNLQEGQEVSFAVMLSKENKPQAFDVMPVDVAGMEVNLGQAWAAFAAQMAAPMMQTGWPGASQAMLKPALAAAVANAKNAGSGANDAFEDCEVVGEYTGTIKSFSPFKGYGFIESPEVKTMYTDDIFLHKNQLGSFGPGDRVTFTLFLNRNNKPQAKDVRLPCKEEAVAGKPKKTATWATPAAAAATLPDLRAKRIATWAPPTAAAGSKKPRFA